MSCSEQSRHAGIEEIFSQGGFAADRVFPFR
jgi:hypothetical protein